MVGKKKGDEITMRIGHFISHFPYKEQFKNKMPALILVSALSGERAGKEWFKFTRAQLLTGTTPDIIKEQIEVGNILVDLRLHDKGTRARNHGTGFRAYESKLPSLFKSIKEI